MSIHLSEGQIRALVDRFLAWPLPETFNPDGGITFEPMGNVGTAHEYKRNPVGTNLLTADEARQMIEYLFSRPQATAAIESLAPISEAALENELQAKGLNAPRLSPASIDAEIVSADYHVFGGVLTVCALTLKNGFMVTGESACASPENYNEDIGRRIAFDNAREKIWAFEGYALRNRLSAAA